MRGRLGEVTMVPDDFRSTDAVRFPASLDGLRKHFLDIARVLDTTDINFRCHGIRRAEMDADTDPLCGTYRALQQKR